jgi:EAL domain-containing protein (putative c-di-GMP-specific phosphodiesterase class I)
VMGRNFGLEVIAEGVETTAQANYLRAEGCQEMQGYLFSKPVPSNMFEKLLMSSPTDAPETDIEKIQLVR